MTVPPVYWMGREAVGYCTPKYTASYPTDSKYFDTYVDSPKSLTDYKLDLDFHAF